jgi:hypothetical protein
MNMLHPSLDELTRTAYGLDPQPEHVEFCVECLEMLRRLRGERRALRCSPSVPAPRSALASLVARLFERVR